MIPPCDALFLGAHPDDVELACGGTILRLTGAGRRVVVVDGTRGEKGNYGNHEERAQEAGDAAKVLGISGRINLGLPDAGLVDDEASVEAVVRVLREHRPHLFFSHLERDDHPDHVACATLAGRAWLLAGIAKKFPDAGPPHRPRLLLRFPGNHLDPPQLGVDVTDVHGRKLQAVACYASQLRGGDRSHLRQGLDILERIKVRDAYVGSLIRAAAGEAYYVDGPLPLHDLEPLMAL